MTATVHGSAMTMTEHPSWERAGEGYQRVFPVVGGLWLVRVQAGRITEDMGLISGARPPLPDVFDTIGLRAWNGDVALLRPIQSLGAVARYRNLDLWDAIATAILRQVIRAAQSKRLYRRLCDEYGDAISLPDGDTYHLFPSCRTILDLPDSELATLGLAFKAKALRAAATAYVQNAHRWRALAPSALMRELVLVPQIGQWTAGAAVADYCNDWSLYPYSDLAVRKWSRVAAPDARWPEDPIVFERVWRSFAGDDLSRWTLLTLAWGSCHGDIG